MILALLLVKLFLFDKLTQYLNKNTHKNIETNYLILFTG